MSSPKKNQSKKRVNKKISNTALAVELSHQLGIVDKSLIDLIHKHISPNLSEDYWDEDREQFPHQIWKNDWLEQISSFKGAALKKIWVLCNWRNITNVWSRPIIFKNTNKLLINDFLKEWAENNEKIIYDMSSSKIIKNFYSWIIDDYAVKDLRERILYPSSERIKIGLWKTGNNDFIMVLNSEDDYKLNNLISDIKTEFKGEYSLVRFVAKHVSTYVSKSYEEKKPINYLEIVIRQETTGIRGLSGISFKGEDVRRGLAAIRSRQEVKYELDQVGTRVIFEDKDLGMKVPYWVKIRSTDGAKKFIKAIQ